MDLQEDQAGSSEDKIKIEEIEDPLPLTEKFESEVKTKDGVLVDMLTGSEAEDTTSEESDSESEDETKENNNKGNKIITKKNYIHILS